MWYCKDCKHPKLSCICPPFVKPKPTLCQVCWTIPCECARLQKLFELKKPSVFEQSVGGIKHDNDKNRIDLIPPELIFALGDILTDGAAKYSEHNWAKGMKYSRVFGACMRHLWQWWWTGEPDKESGKSHLWHAAACIAFLIAYEVRKVGEDDRQIQKPTEKPFRT